MSKITASELAIAQQRQWLNFSSLKSLMALSILFSCLFLSSIVTAQVTTETWTLHSDISGVKVYYGIAECVVEPSPDAMTDPTALSVGTSVLLLKIDNSNTQSVAVSWNNELTTKADIARSTVEVDASSTSKIDCTKAPKLILSESEGDGRPVSVTEAIKLLSINVE